MNRNLIKLYACMLLVAAALVGCGGTDNNPIVTPGPDAQESDTNQPDNQVQPDADAAPEVSTDSDACPNKPGDPCTSPGQPSTCGKLICNCDGKLISDDGTLNAPCPDEAGVDADADSPIQTDADAGTDAETGTDADAQIEQDADASPEADADPAEADAEAGQDADGAVIDVPPPQEICGNGIDDDGNNLTDCQDPACTSYASCQPEVCDGVDNNSNGIVDVDNAAFECVGTPNNIRPCVFVCNGVDLSGHQACSTSTCMWGSCVKDLVVETNCADGIDDDCDLKIDCQDPDCASYVACRSEICNNGVDDNGNGKADCGDPACVSSPYCMCYAPQVGWDCASPGEFSCDPNIRCDCSGIWRLASTPGVFNCMITEVCNGQDDNNNGQADETFACVQHHTTQCATTCNSTGSQYCKDDCTLDACQPPAENCNNSQDDDCDGKSDCSDPDCASAANCQVPELCDGLDNNSNGLIDEHQPCVFNSTQPCTTSCGSTSQQKCIKDPNYNVNCKWDACQPPNRELNCTDGKDDDCDGWTDCLDPDCWGTVTCPHTLQTCQPHPTGTPQSCGTWNQQTLPQVGNRVFAGCANAENDQFAWIGGYNEMEFMHRASSWSVVTMPIGGSPAASWPNIVCLGVNQVYSTYNEKNVGNGVFVRWDGTSVTRLAEQQTSGLVIGPMCAADPNHVYFIGRNGSNLKDALMYKWNGSSLTTSPLPSFGDSALGLAGMHCASPTSVYAAGSLFDPQLQTSRAALLHWDGTSWTMIQVPNAGYGFNTIRGTSECDVMAVGLSRIGSDAYAGLTYQRNGNSWDAKTYSNLESIWSVVKTAPHRYLLGGHSYGGSMTPAQLGTDNGDFTVTWTQPGPGYWEPTASWSIPGTNKLVSAGEGGPGSVILDSVCQ
ncbi:MAG: hypothetical protein ACYC44_03340 [Patescibacteria group bacterium]